MGTSYYSLLYGRGVELDKLVFLASAIETNLSDGGIHMNQKISVDSIVTLADASKIFGRNGRTTVAVDRISFNSKPGEIVLFLGPSGSGKTTLLTLIAGLLPPTSGEVILFGKLIESYTSRDLQQLRARRMGFVFQTFELIDALTAEENIRLVLHFNGHKKHTAKEKASMLLSQLHIEHLAQKLPTEMSQGEKQRIAVARAIANNPELILADEPTANLESTQGFEVIRLLHQYAKVHQSCVIVASHDLRLAEYADRVIRMADGILTSS
jgi:putative ABC transport system ATP-binding protein